MSSRRTLYSHFLRRLLPMLVGAYTLAALIIAGIHYEDQGDKTKQEREQTLKTFAHVLSKPLWDCDSLTAAGIVEAMILVPNVLWASAPDQCANKQISSGIPPSARDADTLSMRLDYVDEHGRSHSLGTLSIAFQPLSPIATISGNLLLQLVIFLTTLAAVLAGALWTFERTVGKPLSQLRVAMHGHEAVDPIPASWTTELTEVTQTYNDQLRELRSQARHDALTGLGNRLKLDEELDRAIRQARRTGRRGHVLLLDLDEFKSINDTHGHAAGDAILCVVAERLRDSVRDTDTVIRLGGDEFVVIAPPTFGSEPEPASDSELYAEMGPGPYLAPYSGAATLSAPISALKQRIIASIAKPIQWKGKPLRVRASIGVARFDGQGETMDALLARADARMYRDKSQRVEGPEA